MPPPARGLYELLITEALRADLSTLPDRLASQERPLSSADAPDRLALHVARIVKRAVATIPDKDRVAKGIALARDLIALIDSRLAGC
ncbi:MAG: hypothetical protein IT381_01840 [Deltaproteobacteria bacterium]|nr:hypothetical protein [Deltaproteobacteria bacterium]